MATSSEEHLDLQAAFNGPAIMTNRFLAVVFDQNMVRIAFLEKPNPVQDPRFRAAVVMSTGDAKQLAELLNKVVEASSPTQED